MLKFLTWLMFTLLPHHALSGLMRSFTSHQISWLKNWQIRTFIKRYEVNMQEAIHSDPKDYPSFQAFFTRALIEGARPIAKNQLVSPVDGIVGGCHNITSQTILDAKGENYSIKTLIGEDGDKLMGGQSVTLYLSPKHYHRVHLPTDATLTKMRYIPGRLFSVDPKKMAAIGHVYTRNERVAMFFETANGPLVIVMIGALFVGGIVTNWHGLVEPMSKPWQKAQIHSWLYPDPLHFKKGDCLGYFEMGSCVITLTNNPNWQFKKLNAGDGVKMGEALIQAVTLK